MALELDPLTDLRLDGDRQVSVDASGDLATVTGIDNVKQSTAIHAGQALRPLIGDPVNAQTLSEAQTRLRDILQRDPQLDGVQRVVIDTIDREANTVDVRVFVGVNNDFRLNINVQ